MQTAKPIAILFSSSVTATPLYKALSVVFKKTMDLYVVKDSSAFEAAKQKLGVNKIPGLLAMRYGEEPTLFSGP